MEKPSRNAPCPCGSGKKYKRCCLPKDQAAEIEAARARQAAAAAEAAAASASAGFILEEEDEFTELSNRTVDLIREGRLQEAERACRELKDRFPDMIDWLERTGMLHEAKGEVQEAVKYYRRCLDFIEEHSEDFEEASRDWYRDSIERLAAQSRVAPDV